MSILQRPTQLVLAGKAHPSDEEGQALIHEWKIFFRQPEIRPHVIFLRDYDMLLTERVIQGMDVWINTPRRPREVGGTCVMKVLVNGGINPSELVDWLAEAHTPELGWVPGDGKEHGDDSTQDAIEVDTLYRALREQTEQHYLLAATAYRKRDTDKDAAGKDIINWVHFLKEKWSALHFGEVRDQPYGEQHAYEIQMFLADLDPEDVHVELYADGINGGTSVWHEMRLLRPLDGTTGDYIYSTAVSSIRPSADNTARLIPHFGDVAIPLEAEHSLWQK